MNTNKDASDRADLASATARVDANGSDSIREPAPFRFAPEELQRFRDEISEEELVALVREMEESGGGLQLSDFLPELKKAAGIDD